MNPPPTPVVHQYQQALDAFRREGREGTLLKRMSELISLLDLTTTLGSTLSGEEILDAALLIVMGELQVGRGALLVADPDGSYRPRAARGVKDLPSFRPEGPLSRSPVRKGDAGFPIAMSEHGFELACPIRRGDRVIAQILLGQRAGERAYEVEEMAFLESVAACAAIPIENGLVYAELRDVNQKLSRKVFELRNLFDLSRELTSSFDAEAIRNLFVATVMGHLMVSRAALFLGGVDGLHLVHERGARTEGRREPLSETEARAALSALTAGRPVRELPAGELRDRLTQARLAFAFPLSVGDRLEGLVGVGERASGHPFTEEDQDFVRTLGRQALAALDNVRLHRVALEKERQDRELQIAREIQRSLFPSECPKVPGYDLAATSQACYEVGGDHYDFIPLDDGRLAFTVADVSGKGTPASILMASVHASLRALAGASSPSVLMDRVNTFLYESTQANKFVTLFYGELEPKDGTLRYVRGGHVPPYLVRKDGTIERLEEGGPALGLLEDATFVEGRTRMGPGDTLAIVTDGATEAMTTMGEELGDAGVCRALREASGRPAEGVLEALLDAVERWTGPAGCSDDLTALILRAEDP